MSPIKRRSSETEPGQFYFFNYIRDQRNELIELWMANNMVDPQDSYTLEGADALEYAIDVKNYEAVELFLACYDYRHHTIIHDAYKMLGCGKILENDFDGAKKTWLKSLEFLSEEKKKEIVSFETRFRTTQFREYLDEPSHMLFSHDWEPIVIKETAYRFDSEEEYLCPCHISDADRFQLHVQAILITDRILGPRHSSLFDVIVLLGIATEEDDGDEGLGQEEELEFDLKRRTLCEEDLGLEHDYLDREPEVVEDMEIQRRNHRFQIIIHCLVALLHRDFAIENVLRDKLIKQTVRLFQRAVENNKRFNTCLMDYFTRIILRDQKHFSGLPKDVFKRLKLKDKSVTAIAPSYLNPYTQPRSAIGRVVHESSRDPLVDIVDMLRCFALLGNTVSISHGLTEKMKISGLPVIHMWIRKYGRNYRMVELLGDRGFPLKSKNECGRTPLEVMRSIEYEQSNSAILSARTPEKRKQPDEPEEPVESNEPACSTSKRRSF